MALRHVKYCIKTIAISITWTPLLFIEWFTHTSPPSPGADLCTLYPSLLSPPSLSSHTSRLSLLVHLEAAAAQHQLDQYSLQAAVLSR